MKIGKVQTQVTFVGGDLSPDHTGELMTIDSTFLGIEDHGIATFFLQCSNSEFGIGVGGYMLDTPITKIGLSTTREGTAEGMQYILGIISVMGVTSWESLKGKKVIVVFKPAGDFGKVVAGIANPDTLEFLAF